MDKIKLSIEPEALDFIVDKAVEFKLGARGLRSICETIMADAMFELPSSDEKSFKLTLGYARKKISKTNMKKLRVA